MSTVPLVVNDSLSWPTCQQTSRRLCAPSIQRRLAGAGTIGLLVVQTTRAQGAGQVTRMTGGETAVATLRAHGVEVVFGMPGVHNLALYDALCDAPEIRHVVVRHEQAAGFAADGYARATGRPGVAITTAGPGATNALTAIAEAWSDSSPVVLIASHIESPYVEQERGFGHELL